MELEFAQDTSGLTGVVTDITPPNTYPSPTTARGDAANYLIFSKTDSQGARVFHNPSFGSVLSVLSWAVDTAVSGLYEAILLRITPYDNGANYVEEQESGGEITQYASIVYYPSTDKVYKCIAPSTGNLPTDTDFWVEITDLSTIIDNENISQVILNINSDKLIDMAIAKKFVKDGCRCSLEDAQYNNQLIAQKRAAEINFASGNIYEYEQIIEQLNDSVSAD